MTWKARLACAASMANTAKSTAPGPPHLAGRPSNRPRSPGTMASPMARFVVDVSAVLHLASASDPLATGHKLLAPTLLRSQTLSALHEAVHRGEIPADVARERLGRIGRMPIRLLGNAVLRRRAWEIADQLGWASTYEAEYLALTQLQADAF